MNEDDYLTVEEISILDVRLNWLTIMLLTMIYK